jgi:predicted permease
VEPGFEAAGVAVASFNSESWGYDEARAHAFYGALRDRLAALPDVTGVSYAMSLPLTMQSTGDLIQPDAAQPDATPNLPVRFAKVDTNYFDVIRLPIRQGRAFSRTDTTRAPSVAIVNETFARRCWPHDTAIGRTFRYGDHRVTIVGVARDAKYSTLSEETPAFVYFPLAQFWEPRQTLLVRAIDTQVPLAQLSTAIQSATRSLDPALPQPSVTTLLQENAIVLLPQRVAAIVTGALGALGLLLATVGLYGIVASSVSRRTREIAIRMAVGACQADVLRLIVRDGVRLTGIGVVIGWLLAWATTRVLAGFLFDVSPLDIVAFAGMSTLFVVTSVIANYLPARRATTVDPVIALRGE